MYQNVLNDIERERREKEAEAAAAANNDSKCASGVCDMKPKD